MFDDLKGKIVVVTGGVTGIGGAASLAFAAEGARVFAQYHGGGKELAEIEKAGIATMQLDLTEKGAPQRLMDAALAKFGRIDVLVNNAGTLVGRVPVVDLDDEFIDKVFDLNCRQLMHCCRIAARQMIAQGSGTIINVTSIAARQGSSAGGAVYGGAKAFVSAFSKTLAKELVGHGIRVNCIAPGAIETERTRAEAPDYAATWSPVTPLRRIGRPEDLTGPLMFLISEAAGFVTGQTLWVDGGAFTQANWPYPT